MSRTMPTPELPDDPRFARNFVDGEWCFSIEGYEMDVRDPATSEALAEVPRSSRNDVEAAVGSARRAARRWRSVAPAERAAAVGRAARALEPRAAEIALVVARDAGRPMDVALAGVRAAVDWMGSLGATGGDPSPVTAPPLGVVVADVGYARPFVDAARVVAAAVCGGNAVVIKPSEHAPLAATYLAEAFAAADVPRGLVNLLQGPGPDTGAALVVHPGVDAVAVAGVAAVVRPVLRSAVGGMKPVVVEVTGPTTFVVADGAPIDRVADAVADATVGRRGRSPGARVLASPGVADALGDALAARLGALAGAVGVPWDAATTSGPMITEWCRDRLQAHVARARERGTLVLAGGTVLDARPLAMGWFHAPTLLRDDDPGQPEDLVGPLCTLTPVDDWDSVLDAPFWRGASASVWPGAAAGAALAPVLPAAEVLLGDAPAPDTTAPLPFLGGPLGDPLTWCRARHVLSR